jgi:hypothetical protein
MSNSQYNNLPALKILPTQASVLTHALECDNVASYNQIRLSPSKMNPAKRYVAWGTNIWHSAGYSRVPLFKHGKCKPLVLQTALI